MIGQNPDLQVRQQILTSPGAETDSDVDPLSFVVHWKRTYRWNSVKDFIQPMLSIDVHTSSNK